MCDLAWHPQCVVELVKFPCKIHKSKDQDVEEDEYIKLDIVSILYIKLIYFTKHTHTHTKTHIHTKKLNNSAYAVL